MVVFIVAVIIRPKAIASDTRGYREFFWGRTFFPKNLVAYLPLIVPVYYVNEKNSVQTLSQ